MIETMAAVIFSMLFAAAFFTALDTRHRLDRQRIELQQLAATVAKLQADQRTSTRPANAPPIGSFSFKGAGGK